MTLINARIPELDRLASLSAIDKFAVYDADTGITKYIEAGDFVQYADSNFEWVSTDTYALGDVRTYSGKWWQSLQAANTGNLPTEGAWWTQINKLAATGIKQWQAGIYTDSEIVVWREIDTVKKLARLKTATRPYSSANFETELRDGDWEILTEDDIRVVNEVAHGWAVGTAMKMTVGGWDVSDGLNVIGIIISIVDVDNVVIKLLGDVKHGFTGLTPGSYMYVQPDGLVTADETTHPYGIAIDATSVIVPFFSSTNGYTNKVYSRNQTGAGLTKTQAVYISGSSGQRPLITPAQADAEATSKGTIGLLLNDVANNTDVYVVTGGLITNVDTSAFLDGDVLWLSETVAGGLTKTIPESPNHAVHIGWVVKSHATLGVILVSVENGYELNELHDVYYPAAPTDGQALVYVGANSRWEPKSAGIVEKTFTSVMNFEKSYKMNHTVAGAIAFTKGVETHVYNNKNIIYLKADGINKPTFSADFEIIADNYNNTLNVWNRVYAEYQPSGKIAVWIDYTA